MCDKEKEIKVWVKEYTDDFFKHAFYKTSSREIAEDLVQDTFLSAYQSWEKFQHKSAPKTWLYAILNNKIRDFYRKQARNVVVTESRLSQDEDSSSLLEAFFDGNGRWKNEMRPSQWEEEEQLLDNTDFNKALQDCMNNLPNNWSSIIILKYLKEKKGTEICKEIEISPSNLWQILYRARLQLRACLEQNWFKNQDR